MGNDAPKPPIYRSLITATTDSDQECWQASGCYRRFPAILGCQTQRKPTSGGRSLTDSPCLAQTNHCGSPPLTTRWLLPPDDFGPVGLCDVAPVSFTS